MWLSKFVDSLVYLGRYLSVCLSVCLHLPWPLCQLPKATIYIVLYGAHSGRQVRRSDDQVFLMIQHIERMRKKQDARSFLAPI